MSDALAAAGVTASGISVVVNCHLHFDHIGGNPAFAGTPVYVQAEELATAQPIPVRLCETADALTASQWCRCAPRSRP